MSTGFPKQEFWNGLPFPSPGHLPNPGGRKTVRQGLETKHSNDWLCWFLDSWEPAGVIAAYGHASPQSLG